MDILKYWPGTCMASTLFSDVQQAPFVTMGKNHLICALMAHL